jgi:hypothetical protein
MYYKRDIPAGTVKWFILYEGEEAGNVAYQQM